MNASHLRSAIAGMLVTTASVAVANETVEIHRDIHGVPHVFAQSDAGAMYGAGYAAASDRLYQMHTHRRTVQGRLAELIGLKNGAGGMTTLSQDKLFRHRRYYVHAQEVADNIDLETRALLQAYCDGVNAYIAANSGALDPLFDGEVPEDWRPADCIAVWDRVSEWFGGGVPSSESAKLHEIEAAASCEAYIAANPTTAVIDEAAAVMQEAEAPPELIDAICDFAASVGYPCDGNPDDGTPRGGGLLVTDEEYPRFSHAWVVGGDALGSGSTAVFSDPQTSIHAPSIWYEIHVVGETFDARGLSFPGCPGFLIGFSRDMAWGVTAMGMDTKDTFRLATNPGGTTFDYGGRTFPIHSRGETILIKTANGFDAEVIVSKWTDDHGPVVTPLMNNVFPGEEYVLKALPLVDNDRHSVQAAISMMRATNTDEFFDAVAKWRFPTIHCLFGDASGAIGYKALGGVPIRSTLSCIGGSAAQNLTVEEDWQGFIPPEFMPQVMKPDGGALFSGNHIPVGSWYPLPLHLGQGGSGDGARSWRLRERLDLTLTPLFQEADVQSVHFDDTNPFRRTLVRTGVHLRDETHVPPVTLSADALSALTVLDSWLANGAHSSTQEPFFAAAFLMDTAFRLGDAPNLVPIWGGNNLAHMLKDVKARLDAHTNQDPAQFTADEIAYVDNALAEGWRNAVQQFGADPAGWQAPFEAQHGSRTVRYHESIAGFGSLDPSNDVQVTGLVTTDGNTILSQGGQSYSMFAALAAPDRSRGLHPIGNSEDPLGPFYSNEAAGWVSTNLRGAPIELNSVLNILHSTDSETYCPCIVDMNGDGLLEIFDLLAYLALWFAGDPAAEFSGDVPADIGIFDMLAYLSLWFQGC